MTRNMMCIALLGLLLPVKISAQEECDDSAYIQSRHAEPVKSEAMTPAVAKPSFMEVQAEATPDILQCGSGSMYNFGGDTKVEPQCTTTNSNTPFATHCTYPEFNDREFESTCWWPYQAGSDYCRDTFEPKATNQVSLEGLKLGRLLHYLKNRFDGWDIGVGNNKSACFTAMPAQLCPKYVCVSAGGVNRNCYETGGKSCQVETVDGYDTLLCDDWVVGKPFCLASMSRDPDDQSQVLEIHNFAVQWECCQSGGEAGDPHVNTMDGKHYTLLQEGTFKLWSLSNFSTDYVSSEQHDQLTPQLKTGQVNWEVYVHYSTGRSFSKGLLLVDKSLGKQRQALELTSENCRWHSKLGDKGEWNQVDKPMPVFMADGPDFVTGFNLSATGRKNGQMDVRFMMNSKYGIKRVATLKISCKAGHHINTKLRLEKSFLKDKQRGQIRPGRRLANQSTHGNISQTLTEMRKLSSLQMMQDQEDFVDDTWVNIGGSSRAALYLQEVDDQLTGARSLVTTCTDKEEEVAKQTCVKWMGDEIVNATGRRRDSFLDCIFDVCAGAGEAAAELAAEIMEEGDF